jgi:hypothetical protein
VRPGEEEAHGIGGGHRLDRAPQSIARAAVNAREESPVAPFGDLGRRPGRDATPQNIAFALDVGERCSRYVRAPIRAAYAL